MLASDLTPDDWRRICDALRYLARDLHHRSFAVSSERRELLWQEMDRCLALADQLAPLMPWDDTDLNAGPLPPSGFPSPSAPPQPPADPAP